MEHVGCGSSGGAPKLPEKVGGLSGKAWETGNPTLSQGEPANTLIVRGFVAHNCAIGENCVFDANATLACHVTVGDQAFLPIGAMVREGVAIGERAIVGAGAAVFLDVEDGLYVVGNSARPMRRNDDQTVFRG